MAPVSRLVARNDPEVPGLFVNPEWEEGTPGTFAVVIGVSAYPYLDGGARRTPGYDTFGLGQLFVSAATAYRFFLWLSSRYGYPAAPPAKCWLLLSPTAEELAKLGAGTVEELGAAPANLINCDEAIKWWSDTMEQLPRAAAEQSRGLFFFSGHGLEVWQERQILLPTDYLRPPGRNVNDAISTANLRKGLASNPVPHQFLFVDACRNDVRELRQYVVEGKEILNVRQAAGTNPDAFTGLLYAATSGTQTWQPQELAKGYSLFGGAVVDGLDGAEGLELEGCAEDTCEVRFYPLQTFVRARMTDVLKEFKSTEKARVRDGGTPPEGGITFVRKREPVRGDRPAVASSVSALADRYDVHHDNLSWTPQDDYGTGHDIFGSERMTDIWAYTLRVNDLRSGAEISRDQIVVRYVRRSDDTRTFLIGLELPFSPYGHWLQFTDAVGSEFACSLGGDQPLTPVYELEIDFERGGEGQPSRVSKLEAGLSSQAPGPMGVVARIWDTYETHNVAVAAGDVDLALMEEVLQGKMKSPLSAAAAGVILLRARRFDLLHDTWLRNLSDWFPDHPDGAVLWAEQVRLTGRPEGEAVETRLDHLGRLTDRGLPRLSELLPTAWRHLAELEEEGLDPAWRQPLLERVVGAVRYQRPGGTFAVFSSGPGVIGPHLVMPAVG